MRVGRLASESLVFKLADLRSKPWATLRFIELLLGLFQLENYLRVGRVFTLLIEAYLSYERLLGQHFSRPRILHR